LKNTAFRHSTGKAFCAFLLAITTTAMPLSAADYISKEHRNSFASPSLQKNFYKIEGQTTRFFDRQHSSVNGLIESFRGTSCYAYDLFTKAFTYGHGGVLDCQAFTYDNAVAMLTYLIAGQDKKAADILKVYRKEFYYDKNDHVGLFNSYRTDKDCGNGGLTLGIDGDRIHLGPTMWVGIAALQYTALTGDLQFLSLVIDMAKWTQRLNHYRFPDGQKGAPSMGFGWGPDWSTVYSTENVVDYYAVLTMLREIYIRGDDKIKNIYNHKSFGLKDMDFELAGVTRWMKDVAYDKEKKAFNCGSNENGPDRTAALDTVSWTIAAFGPEKLERMGVDPFALIDHAESQFLVKCALGDMKIEGFDFTNPQGRNRSLRMVWFEGTGLQTVTYQVMSRYAKKKGIKDRAEAYRQKAIKFSNELQRASEIIKLADSALPYTSRCPAEQEIILTFRDEWEIPRGNKGQWVSSASSTGWRYFALAGFNPLSFDEEVISYRLFAPRLAER
jgi:hypothetical protein